MKIERRSRVSALAALVICALVLPLSGCGREDVPPPPEQSRSTVESRGEEPASEVVVHFDRQLDGYQPQKQEYNFYFTYKMVHPWWDAVALGCCGVLWDRRFCEAVRGTGNHYQL